MRELYSRYLSSEFRLASPTLVMSLNQFEGFLGALANDSLVIQKLGLRLEHHRTLSTSPANLKDIEFTYTLHQ